MSEAPQNAPAVYFLQSKVGSMALSWRHALSSKRPLNVEEVEEMTREPGSKIVLYVRHGQSAANEARRSERKRLKNAVTESGAQVHVKASSSLSVATHVRKRKFDVVCAFLIDQVECMYPDLGQGSKSSKQVKKRCGSIAGAKAAVVDFINDHDICLEDHGLKGEEFLQKQIQEQLQVSGRWEWKGDNDTDDYILHER